MQIPSVCVIFVTNCVKYIALAEVIITNLKFPSAVSGTWCKAPNGAEQVSSLFSNQHRYHFHGQQPGYVIYNYTCIHPVHIGLLIKLL